MTDTEMERRKNMMKDELKPCPYCGNYPLLRHIASEWRVYCIGEGCECLPSTWFHDTKEEAIEAWNRRASDEL